MVSPAVLSKTTIPAFDVPVSYTHLDVYKRQALSRMLSHMPRRVSPVVPVKYAEAIFTPSASSEMCIRDRARTDRTDPLPAQRLLQNP